ncbi:putative F-box protein At2g02030 [Aegilops tauschii subsp. strangulata]|uniref:putative F-box protein At2g02030 n=1 Tax=Aegilops tauschii subsp. strangulata TaxID=200361 RepID=UPI001E1CA77E|nr:putative F-box protein At2g02030 [Aegilops tauschii subsp. strangulata]
MMMADNKSMAMLPEEMITEVLVRLPVKAILRSRAVCRRWAALVSSEEFCAAKEAAGAGSATEPVKLLFLSRTARFDSTEVRSSDDDGGMPLLTLNGMRRDEARMTSTPCRGLTLLHDPYSGFYVLNAATRAVTMLPPCEDKILHSTTAGLGFDAKTKESKVVRLFIGDGVTPWEAFTRARCEVHTLGGDRWRTISVEGVPCKFAGAALFGAVCDKLAPVFADGFLHWLIHPKFHFATRPAAAVLSFSVADETFSWVRAPPFDWEGAHLTELDSGLCMVREDLLPRASVLSSLEIWKVREDNGGWSLEHRVDLVRLGYKTGYVLTVPQYGRVVGKQGKKMILATSFGRVFAYDLMSQTLELILRLGGISRYETERPVARISLFKERLTPVQRHGAKLQ